MSRNRETSSIKSIIDKMIDESRLKPGMTEINVKEAWVDLMGPGVAKYTRAIHLRAQVLEVKLDSSVLRENTSSVRICARVLQRTRKRMSYGEGGVDCIMCVKFGYLWSQFLFF